MLEMYTYGTHTFVQQILPDSLTLSIVVQQHAVTYQDLSLLYHLKYLKSGLFRSPIVFIALSCIILH